jgi:hypothetical protein
MNIVMDVRRAVDDYYLREVLATENNPIGNEPILLLKRIYCKNLVIAF